MAFIARFSVKDAPVPVLAYLHEAGYGLWSDNGHSLRNASRYAGKIFRSKEFKEIAEQSRLDYVLAGLWNNEGLKTADVFGYNNFEEDWKKSNPEISAWNCVNGIWQKKSPVVLCGDMTILLGEEETWRRASTGSLDYFIDNAPHRLSNLIWKPLKGNRD